MSDVKPPAKKDTSESSSLLAGINTSDATKATSKLHTDAHEKTQPAAPHHAEHVNWRSELRHATTEMKQLDKLKADDPTAATKRTELINSIDKHFQKALPLVHRDARSADGELLRNVSRATLKETEFKDFQVNGKTMHLKSANMDEIHNAILNAPDEATRKKLTQFAGAAEAHKLAIHNVDKAYEAKKAPMMAAMDYANFLLKNKDGISQNSKGETFTAGDVLDKNMSREMAHSPRGKELTKLSQDAKVDHQNALIPSEKNPMVLLHEAQAPGVDKEVAMTKLKNAVELAKDPNFKAMVDQAAKSPEAQKDPTAIKELQHAQALSEGYLGQALLLNGNPKDAATHLVNAAQDPEGAAMLKQGANDHSFGIALSTALQGTEQTMQAYKQSMTDVENNQKLAETMSAAKDSDGVAQALKAAGVSADAAVQNAIAAKGALGEENGKKIETEFNSLVAQSKTRELTPEEAGMVQVLQPLMEARKAEVVARFTRGNLELDSNNHNAALADLQAVQKMDPAFASDPAIKPALDENLKKAKEGADYDNSGWWGKRLSDSETMLGNAWDYVKEHPKMVAAGVAFAIATGVVTVATGGLGAPVMLGLGEAALAGGIAGTVGGTLAGATIEKTTGQNTFVGGVGDTFLPAVGGAALGTAFGAAKFVANPFVMNTLKGAALGAIPSFNNARENYLSGKDRNLFAAGVDFATDEAGWAVGGGVTMGANKWLRPLVPVAGIALAQTANGIGTYYANKIQIDSNYYKLATSQAEAQQQAITKIQEQIKNHEPDQPGQ